MAKFLPQNYKKVLEVGCGEGTFIDNLNIPCEYWGIEPVHEIAKIASGKLHKVLIGLYEDVYEQLPNNYFDLVICNDVIEHMKEHDSFFETIKEKIKEDSFIVGSIPNVRYVKNLYELLIKKDWAYNDAGILDRTHLRFFTEKSLKRTILDHGFLIESFHGINSAIIKSKAIKILIRNTIILIICFGSFGYYKDIQFLQYGFRARYKASDADTLNVS